MDLSYFKEKDFVTASLEFFAGLEVPVQLIETAALQASDVLKPEYNRPENPGQALVQEFYAIGIVTDAVFQTGNNTEEAIYFFAENDRYEGILLMGVTMRQKENGRDPNRSELAEIARKLNQSYPTKPVVTIFRYADKLAFANAERADYKQDREGEKIGKISLLRDIDLTETKQGHRQILDKLRIPRKGKDEVKTFEKLHEHWRKALDVEVLNKEFYRDLQHWYLWAIKEVRFPEEPTREKADSPERSYEEMLREHRATNVIRLLTRLLFCWFMKAKGVMPDELFDLRYLKENLLQDFEPDSPDDEQLHSTYYRAILQNLFFATLNCPIESGAFDKRERGFRKKASQPAKQDENFGTLSKMRYEELFKDSAEFLNLVNAHIPFLNGGLFECLDIRGVKGERKKDRRYFDGFSDNLPQSHELVVPDYLFFGHREVDLTEEYGSKKKALQNVPVEGLIHILNSYIFTVSENTAQEEEVALDPELLGKVFENLLASYNPETKNSARKQTGSFYTPRPIVNYMVTESLVAYFKNKADDWLQGGGEQLDQPLRQILDEDGKNPWKGEEDQTMAVNIIDDLVECKVFDPACGSGAFPMGVLHKLVVMLRNLDPGNEYWKFIQREKAKKAADEAYDTIDNTQERRDKLSEIDEVFDRNINDPDYARKLYLIENCLYGVDIQPIAVHITKLRFFISLLVDQQIGSDPSRNFGVRALPNLETKFVAANTLVGLEKPPHQPELFEDPEIEQLKDRMRQVRQRYFNAHSSKAKGRAKAADEQLKQEIADKVEKKLNEETEVILANSPRQREIEHLEQLKKWEEVEKLKDEQEARRQALLAQNHGTASQLSQWKTYDQNATSDFFDPEWMFDVRDGFDVVIGNPPYKQVPKGIFNKNQFPYSEGKDKGKQNLYKVFIESSKNLSRRNTGTVCLIVQGSLLCDLSSTYTRELLLTKTIIEEIIEFPKSAPTNKGQVFENVLQGTCIYRIINNTSDNDHLFKISVNNDIATIDNMSFEYVLQKSIFELYPDTFYIPLVKKGDFTPINSIKDISQPLMVHLNGIHQGDLNLTSAKNLFSDEDTGVKLYRGKNVQRYHLIKRVDEYVQRGFKNEKVDVNSKCRFLVCQEITGTTDRYRLHFCATEKGEKFLFGHTVNKLSVNKEEYVEPLAVILNSKFPDWIFRKTSTNNHVMGYEISQLPIPIKFVESINLLSLFYSLLNYIIGYDFNDKILIEAIANGIVLNLFFSDHMQEREIDVLEFVERDMQKVLQGREFDSLDYTEKEKVVDQLHATWSDPDNEVVKRMAQFKEKSPDILKPILESTN